MYRCVEPTLTAAEVMFSPSGSLYSATICKSYMYVYHSSLNQVYECKVMMVFIYMAVITTVDLICKVVFTKDIETLSISSSYS